MRAHANIQREYMTRRVEAGYKRIQLWKLDESNKSVQQKIKIACKRINQDNSENELLDEISIYTHNLLQSTPL